MLYLPAVRHPVIVAVETARIGFTGVNNAVMIGILDAIQQAVGITVGIVKEGTTGVFQAVRETIVVTVGGGWAYITDGPDQIRSTFRCQVNIS